MCDFPPDPHASSERHGAAGKGALHIPGAGTQAMGILVVSLTMLFFGSIAAYLVVRYELEHQNPGSVGSQWPPAGSPGAPHALWISTLVILISSVTIQLAMNAIRRDDEKRLLLFLRATFVLGFIFLCLQTINWLEFYHAIPTGMTLAGVYLCGFYVLTGLHAVHVLGGLIPLGVVIFKAGRGTYSRNFHPGVRYSTIYWHFLDAIWVILFCIIYF